MATTQKHMSYSQAPSQCGLQISWYGLSLTKSELGEALEVEKLFFRQIPCGAHLGVKLYSLSKRVNPVN